MSDGQRRTEGLRCRSSGPSHRSASDKADRTGSTSFRPQLLFLPLTEARGAQARTGSRVGVIERDIENHLSRTSGHAPKASTIATCFSRQAGRTGETCWVDDVAGAAAEVGAIHGVVPVGSRPGWLGRPLRTTPRPESSAAEGSWLSVGTCTLHLLRCHFSGGSSQQTGQHPSNRVSYLTVRPRAQLAGVIQRPSWTGYALVEPPCGSGSKRAGVGPQTAS